MAGYAGSVKKDIARWQADGLIDAATANALSADIERYARNSISFGTILSILAACLLAAALLLLIAANWEAFPRLLRVALVFALILGGYIGGAIFKRAGSDALAESLWLVAAAGFGGGIALIGQMYHLSGDETQAILVWCGGTLLAAAALRSGPLTAGAALLGGAWMLLVATGYSWRGGEVPLGYLPLALAIWAVSLWTNGSAARHLVLLTLMAFCAVHYFSTETLVAPLALAAASIGLFALCLWAATLVERWTGLGEGGLVQGLLGFIVAMSAIQAELYERPEFLYVAIVVFAGVIVALVLAGRESRMLRWLAYAGFIFELCFVYVVLLGSMIGTAGFFLVAGVVLAGFAWLIRRLESRFSRSTAREVAA